MFSKMAIYVFCVVGFFAILFSSIPGQFFEAAFSSSIGADKDIAEYFDLANVTMYGNAGSDNMTWQYSSYHNHPDAPQFAAGLPSGQYLQVWWGYDLIQVLEFRHVAEVWWGLNILDRLRFTNEAGDKLGIRLYDGDLEAAWDPEINGSVFYATGRLSTSVIFGYNQTTYSSITEAWNNYEISFVLSYEVDWNATQVSAMTILGQLLTFQNPDLGVPGVGGYILNMAIAIPMIVMTLILIIILVQSVIPFIKGINE